MRACQDGLVVLVALGHQLCQVGFSFPLQDIGLQYLANSINSDTLYRRFVSLRSAGSKRFSEIGESKWRKDLMLELARRLRHFIGAIIVVGVLVGCGSPNSSSPEVMAVTPTHLSPIALSVTPATTAEPTPTTLRTATLTTTPVFTPTPTDTPRPTTTPIPTWTPSPTITPTPTPHPMAPYTIEGLRERNYPGGDIEVKWVRLPLPPTIPVTTSPTPAMT